VVCVSWNDANKYADWLSEVSGHHYGLASEAQWEYAARGQTTTSRYWGDKPDEACQYANVDDASHSCKDGYENTAPVDSLKANAFRLYDMLGNAWEWTQDCWHESYEGAQTDGSAWTEGVDCSLRVIRGGSWLLTGPRSVRSAGRGGSTPGNRGDDTGFRLARTIE